MNHARCSPKSAVVRQTFGSLAAFTLCLLLTTVQTVAAKLPPAPNVEKVKLQELKRHLSFLSSPEVGGRFTFSVGNRVAARYLASQLEFFGFQGAMPDKSFFQVVPFTRREVNLEKTRLTLGNNPTAFQYLDDFIVYEQTCPQKVEATADLVFVGYGYSSPENGYDDYQGLDVKGKIAVTIPFGTPKALEGKTLPNSAIGVGAAEAHGAVGVITIPDSFSEDIWKAIKAGAAMYGGRPSLKLTIPGNGDVLPRIPNILAGPKLATSLMDLLGMKYEALRKLADVGDPIKPQALNTTCQANIVYPEILIDQARNVVGILEGSDPKLKNEYVVLSAHYDHLEGNEKRYFPGADDDGSGTSAVLELARVLGAERPRRSVIVLFNTGEEIGLLGSEYFVENSPVPLSQIVANFNIDMIGRSRAEGDTKQENSKLTDANSVYLIGPDKHSTELFAISEVTNQEITKFTIDYTYNNENDPSRFFYRSDHWNFAKKGIPVIFYFNGVHEDYHRPTDTLDKIDFEKMTRVTRLVYATMWRVANLDERLKIDKWKTE